MSKYTGARNKLFRNFGVKDLSNRKLTSSMRQTASGQHGAVRKKLSEYALHLNEKQKIRLTYLVSEKQFAKYYNEAARRKGVTGTILLQLLDFTNTKFHYFFLPAIGPVFLPRLVLALVFVL